MTKFRKKPIVIDAFIWSGNFECIPDWAEESLAKVVSPDLTSFIKVVGGREVCGRVLIIETLEGSHKASVGDYIIRGVKGEWYPCKPDIFKLTYEKEPE